MYLSFMVQDCIQEIIVAIMHHLFGVIVIILPAIVVEDYTVVIY